MNLCKNSALRGPALLKVLNLWLLAALVFLCAAASAAPQDTGIVLMHGKWGAPRPLIPVARELESKGYRVSVPEMAWSGRRLYDVDYPAALAEVAREVEKLRGQGAKRVVVAGHSMGANAAVAYAMSNLPADAIVLLAPGHTPEGTMGRRVQASVQEARRRVSAGEGDSAGDFLDVNQGRDRTLRMSARI